MHTTMHTTAAVLPPKAQTAILFFLVRVAGLFSSGCCRLEVGLRPDQLERLDRVTAPEIEFFDGLVTDQKPLLYVAFDLGHLDAALQRLEARRAENTIRDEFIRRGAPAGMMMDVFRVGLKELIRHRKALGVQCKSGRPKLPDDETQIKVYTTWKALKHPNIRLRYLDLHDAFPDIQIAVLYAISVNRT